MAARLHVCSLGTLELEGAKPTLTTICSWAWIVYGTPSSSFTSHTPRDLDDTRAPRCGKENFSRAKEQPKNCRRVAAAYGIADRG